MSYNYIQVPKCSWCFLFWIFFFQPHYTACWIVPWLQTEPAPSAGEVQTLNHWTAREVPNWPCWLHFSPKPHIASQPSWCFDLKIQTKYDSFFTSFITNLSSRVIFITLIFHFSPIWSQLPLVSLQVTLNMAYSCFKALVLVPLAWNVLPLDIPIACYFTSYKYLLKCLFCSESCSNPLKFHPLTFSIFLTLIKLFYTL